MPFVRVHCFSKGHGFVEDKSLLIKKKKAKYFVWTWWAGAIWGSFCGQVLGSAGRVVGQVPCLTSLGETESLAWVSIAWIKVPSGLQHHSGTFMVTQTNSRFGGAQVSLMVVGLGCPK